MGLLYNTVSLNDNVMVAMVCGADSEPPSIFPFVKAMNLLHRIFLTLQRVLS